MFLHDRMHEMLEKRNLTQADVARATGKSTAAVTKWFKGDTEPSATNLNAIAKLFGVTAEWLLTGRDPKPNQLQESTLRSISPGYVLADDRPQGKIPVISMVQAGLWTPVMSMDLTEAIGHMPWIEEVGQHGFGVIVGGYSMAPYFLPNDRLYVNPDLEPLNEDLVIAMCDYETEATFKQLIIEQGRKYLVPLNKEWLDGRVIQLDNTCSIKGVVVQSIRPVDKRAFRSLH